MHMVSRDIDQVEALQSRLNQMGLQGVPSVPTLTPGNLDWWTRPAAFP